PLPGAILTVLPAGYQRSRPAPFGFDGLTHGTDSSRSRWNPSRRRVCCEAPPDGKHSPTEHGTVCRKDSCGIGGCCDVTEPESPVVRFRRALWVLIPAWAVFIGALV